MLKARIGDADDFRQPEESTHRCIVNSVAPMLFTRAHRDCPWQAHAAVARRRFGL